MCNTRPSQWRVLQYAMFDVMTFAIDAIVDVMVILKYRALRAVDTGTCGIAAEAGAGALMRGRSMLGERSFNGAELLCNHHQL